jgi:tRNA(Ile)-lysidine synthase
VRAGAVIVDHGLQDGSSAVAALAAGQCRDVGLDPVEVVAVRVNAGLGGPGPEGAARAARYAALDAAADRLGAVAVLLGHTRDDQAEQVLLGLARGSGARSLAGMPQRRGRYARPFLCLSREATRAACRAWGLAPWSDPHNVDPAYARARARAALAVLEQALGPGVTSALARSADLLRADADALDDLAGSARAGLGSAPWSAAELSALPTAVRGRVWRLLCAEAGCPPGDLGAVHVGALDALVTAWRGQGPVSLPGGRLGRRVRGQIHLGGAVSG